MSDDSENNEDKSKELMEATKRVLSGLTAREAKVLKMRFGIDLNTNQTLEEVASQFDITRQRIKEIEEKALMKLQGKPEIKKSDTKCSFCGKGTSEVEKMIGSEIEKANICKECILECFKLIQE